MDKLPDHEELTRVAGEVAHQQQRTALTIIRQAAEMKALPTDTVAREEAIASLHSTIDTLEQDVPYSSGHLVAFTIANASADVIGVLARKLGIDPVAILQDIESRVAGVD